MKFRTIRDSASLTGNKVFLRVDFNLDAPGEHARFGSGIATARELLDKGASVILASHSGDPEKSLSPFVPSVLKNLTARSVKFSSDCVGSEASELAKSLRPGEVLLLENLRRHKEEKNNDREFAKALASLADIYVNDAFSCSHRDHASITGITEFIQSFAGPTLQEEVLRIKENASPEKKGSVLILGGAKTDDSIECLKVLIPRFEYVILAGLVFRAAARSESIREEMDETIAPIDFVVRSEEDKNSRSTYKRLSQILDDDMIMDIGPRSILVYKMILSGSAKNVIWNGPLGVTEEPEFRTGTESIACEIARLTLKGRIKSLAGGGHTLSAIGDMAKDFTYVSSGGGAFIKFLVDPYLPGLKVLCE